MTGLVAHAGGLGWDELLLFVSPVVVLVVLQVIGRRKARAENQSGDRPDDRDAEAPET